MASLSKRGDIYYANFYDADRTPKSRRFSLRTPRKRIARRKLTALEEDWDQGLFDPWLDDPVSYKEKRRAKKNLPLQEALDVFLETKEEQGRSTHTIRNYRTFCGGLVERVGPNKSLQRLTPSDVDPFIQDESVTNTTCRTRYRHLQAWLRWCRDEGCAPRAATDGVTPPPKDEKLPKAVRERDMEAIEKAMREDYRKKRKKGRVMEGQVIWRIPLFWFGLYSGLRSSELARLRWRHIDFDQGLIYIHEQKNGKQQTVPLTNKAREVLADLSGQDPDAYVFRSPNADPYERSEGCFANNVNAAFRKYRKKADIDRKLSLHGLRHGYCTLLAEAGKSAPIIKAAARHSNIGTSMRYVEIANTRLKEELDDVF